MSEATWKFIKEESTVLEQKVESASNSKKGFLTWIKVHKTQLILAGVSTTAIVGIILGIKNKDTFVELWPLLAETIKKAPVSTSTSMPDIKISAPTAKAVLQTRTYTPPTKAFDVSRHVRTMAVGKHHSAAKAAEAASLGIDLLPNQTLVGPYTKCAA